MTRGIGIAITAAALLSGRGDALPAQTEPVFFEKDEHDSRAEHSTGVCRGLLGRTTALPKRHGDLYRRIIAPENLLLAHERARRGKARYRSVQFVNANQDELLSKLNGTLETHAFVTSDYITQTRMEGGKLRVIHKLPYYPDRIVHHAICNVCAPIWVKSLIRDTFQSLPGRGISDARRRVQRAIKLHGFTHALQLDIRKFYPSIDNSLMKQTVRRQIKCRATLRLLDEIINSSPGLPLGNYTSQFFGNLYLSPLDWWAKQHLGLRGYFRYCDDIVVLGHSRDELLQVLAQLQVQAQQMLLDIKPDWRVLDLRDEGLDFCGYVFKGGNITLRPRIASAFKQTCKERPSEQRHNRLMAYWGWVKPINAISLWGSHFPEGQT
jgi:hypothetical protein